MALDDARISVRRKLEEMLGVDEADILLDRPPGGWGDLVTAAHFDARMDASERVIDARFTAFDARLTAFEQSVDARFAGFDQRFVAFERSVDARFAGFDQRFAALEQHFDQRFTAFAQVVDARFDGTRGDLVATFHQEITALTWKMVGAITAVGAVIVAAIRF